MPPANRVSVDLRAPMWDYRWLSRFNVDSDLSGNKSSIDRPLSRRKAGWLAGRGGRGGRTDGWMAHWDDPVGQSALRLVSWLACRASNCICRQRVCWSAAAAALLPTPPPLPLLPPPAWPPQQLITSNDAFSFEAWSSQRRNTASQMSL